MDFISEIASTANTALMESKSRGVSWLNSVRLTINNEGRGYMVCGLSGLDRSVKRNAQMENRSHTVKSPMLVPYDCGGYLSAERNMIMAAWEMGAWDLSRMEHPPAGDNAKDPQNGILALFGGEYYALPGAAPQPALDPDILRVAVSEGFVTWFFRPTFNSPRVATNDDVTLAEDGRRPGSPHVELLPFAKSRKHQAVYVFGKNVQANQ